MSTVTSPPIYLTILRRGETNIIDLAEVGALIPRSETRVDDIFLQELAEEMRTLATPGYSRGGSSSGQGILVSSAPSRVSRDLQRLGGLIFSHLFTEPARTRLRTAAPGALYLRLDEQLLAVPWELAFDGQDFLATKFRVGRQVITSHPLPGTGSVRIVEGPLKILLIADPTESLPQARVEVEQLCTMLEEVAGVEVSLLGGKNVRKLPLLAAVQEHDVVHFAGHSVYDPTSPSQSGWRLYEAILTAGEISKLGRPPRLVFSNSCQAGTTAAWEGHPQYEGQAFGIGSAFLLAGVSSYLGTFWVVHDAESVGFAAAFYRSLAAGASLGEAVVWARLAALEQWGGQSLTWASYLLYGDPTITLLSGHDGQPLSELPYSRLDSVAPPAQPVSVSTTGDSRVLFQPSVADRHEEPTPSAILASLPRKLAAIFSADVAGYSRLMGDDEEATIRTLAAYHGVMRRLIRQHRGRVVDSPGDNLLTEFASVVDAVRCAIEIQRELHTRNAELPYTRQMEFRIGINLGDVIVDGEKLYGDGVNIAARLESLAEPGGICISGTVHEQVENKLALGYEYLGEQPVKNIARPVRVYRVREQAGVGAVLGTEKQRKVAPRYNQRVVWVAVALLLFGIGSWAVTLRPPRLRPPVPPAEQPLPLPDKPSIAVLPFVNLSNDPEQEFFSDGITYDIITDLGKLSGLFVIATNSVFTYKGKAVKVEDVGKELGVRYVLEGTTRKVNDRVRITARLIDAETSGHLWAKSYDRDVKDIFAVQDEIVQEIVAILAVKVTEEDQRRLLRRATDNLEAYETVVRAFGYYIRTTKEANVQARQLFARAVELDPKFARAYVGVAVTYQTEWAWQWGNDPWALDLAYTLVQKGLALDPSSPTAHLALGNIYLFQKQHEQAIAEVGTAIALNPSWADAYWTLGYILAFAGRPEETLGAVEKAMRLNPFYPPSYPWCIGRAYRMLGRYEEAAAIQERVISKYPSYLSAHADLAVTYIELGREAEARAEVAEILKISPQYSLAVAGQRVPFKNPADLDRFLAGLRTAGLH